jgi:drug/metabolite transporter (DMT)-like permease
MHFSLRTLSVPVLFALLTYIFGMAWWTVWKEKPSGKSWGIAASLINNLVMIMAYILHKRSLSGYQWEVLAIGIVGLIAFLWPDKEESEIYDVEMYEVETDDTEQYNKHS